MPFVLGSSGNKNIWGFANNITKYNTLPISSPVTITSITNFQSTDVSGVTTVNGIQYNVYAFNTISTTTTYTVNYTCGADTTIYVLAVGGGGSGGRFNGAGGGAGGVVMNPVSLPKGTSQTITVAVGAGGATSSGQGNNGSATTVTIAANTSANIIAGGGGGGGGSANGTTFLPGLNGGSGTGGGGGSGGGGMGGGNRSSPGTAVNNYYTYANSGAAAGSLGGGGGGSGTIASSANGGNGIQCFLPGISSFAPSGTPYSAYYWGGGGGGSIQGGGNAGNGGLGGGGGGANENTVSTNGVGGASAINNGQTSGTNNTGANAGANTGGGGGGSWTGTGGAGGSGIVVIAFPTGTTAVTSNQQAILPSSIVSSNLYNAVLNNATLTTAAYNGMKGAFACRLVNYNYFGPTVTLRYSTDSGASYTKNFYADICGNLGTQYLGTGQSVSSWLSSNSANTTYAYVTKWYNQGMDVSFNCATQYTTSLQPVYDVSNGLLNFGYNGGTFGVNAPSTNYQLNLPDTAFPLGDSSYTITIKHGYMNSLTNVGIWEGGATGGASGSANILITQTTYINDWWNGGVASFGTPTANNVVTVKYTTGGGTNSHMGYINGTSYVLNTTSTRNQLSGSNFIGYSPGSSSNNFNGQLYYMYILNNAVSDADRQLIEATPYQYAPLPLMAITVSSVTSTMFVPSWTAVANATTYVMYINSVVYGTVTSGQTITPGYNGPWTVNVYAYNATYNLLASGSIISGSVYYAGDSTTYDIASLSTNTAASTLATGKGIIFSSNVLSNGSYYNVYAFGIPGTNNYILNYAAPSTKNVYVFAVGGGGGSTNDVGGGGGGGGVVSQVVSVTAGTGQMTISVGAGGTNGGPAAGQGGSSSVVFSGFSTTTVTAGGGLGGTPNYIASPFSSSTNSHGGTSGAPQSNAGSGGGNNHAGGGGGAGGAVSTGNNGGAGLQCSSTLYGVKDFTIAGNTVSNWYWGGGGGGSDSTSGTGGSGGGGTGCIWYGGSNSNGGTGINPGGASTTVGSGTGGNGGANTGGGGGGAFTGTGGVGGSGIVIIAIPM